MSSKKNGSKQFKGIDIGVTTCKNEGGDNVQNIIDSVYNARSYDGFQKLQVRVRCQS